MPAPVLFLIGHVAALAPDEAVPQEALAPDLLALAALDAGPMRKLAAHG